MAGSGTTRDVVAGFNRYKRAGIEYWGGDLREGFDLTQQELPGRFDFVWTSPAVLEHRPVQRCRPGDLSNVADYEQFRDLLMACLKRCYDALEPGGRMAVLIGDVRRQGRYTAIIKDVLNFPHGEIRSVIIKVQHNCTSDRRQYGKLEDPPIKHEYCVVWRKTSVTATSSLPHRKQSAFRRPAAFACLEISPPSSEPEALNRHAVALPRQTTQPGRSAARHHLELHTK